MVWSLARLRTRRTGGGQLRQHLSMLQAYPRWLCRGPTRSGSLHRLCTSISSSGSEAYCVSQVRSSTEMPFDSQKALTFASVR